MEYLRKFKNGNGKIDNILKYLILLIPLSLIAGPLYLKYYSDICIIIFYKLKLNEIFEYDKYLFYLFFYFIL